jgi:hypothetical protein
MKGDRGSICASVLWASFRALDAAQSYLDYNFENHPAISSEFIKSLAPNSGFEIVEQLDATVSAMKATVTSAATDTYNESTKSNTASIKCNVKGMEGRGAR